GCDHAELCKSRDILECHDLRMFNARTQSLSLLSREFLLKGVERKTIARIANGVNVQLPPMLSGECAELFDLFGGVQHESAMVRLIAVVLDHAGPATAECTIDP